MTDCPPFTEGQKAARAGRSRHANPHSKRDEPVPGDSYPGPYHAWLDGWRHERSIMKHDATIRKEKGVDD